MEVNGGETRRRGSNEAHSFLISGVSLSDQLVVFSFFYSKVSCFTFLFQSTRGAYMIAMANRD